MNTNDLFTTALQLTDPWFVEKVEFLPSETKPEELHININFNLNSASSRKKLLQSL